MVSNPYIGTMKSLLITSHKGGVGCSTVASAIAIASAKRGTKTLLVDGKPGQLNGLLGIGDRPYEGEVAEVTENLWLTDSVGLSNNPSQYELVVVDAGMSQSDFGLVNAERLGVVRNCYLSLKNAVNGVKCDSFVCIEETERALNSRDAQSVLQVPVTSIKYETAVNRAVDAGLIVNRVPDIAPWTQLILNKAFA